MASQTDKKEEFRKYLEKGKVLHVLTTVLTDLFEMDSKPDDPLSYLPHRFGESLSKQPSPPNGPQKDLPMSDPDPVPTPHTPNHHGPPQISTDQTPLQPAPILQHSPLPANSAPPTHAPVPRVTQVSTPAYTPAPAEVNPPVNPSVASSQHAPASTAQVSVVHAQPTSPVDVPVPQPVPAAAPPASPAQPAASQVTHPVTTNPEPVQ
eukprot:GFKZ01014683.1.p1 GENE.GFKZ01014683.1~~GFKZ01014683.1.p1  ORF type:complete len:207 (-),score=19.06 GFKZ01014683.1:595-1215(-)